MTVKRTTRALKEVKRTLRKVAPEEVEDVLMKAADDALPRAQERLDHKALPGETINGLKKPWTYDEMLKRFKVVSFVPEETVPLTWNGVRHQCLAGIESHIPEPFYKLYLDSKAKTREAGKRLQNSQGFETTIGIGAGALPPG